jgi:hypothetical protein
VNVADDVTMSSQVFDGVAMHHVHMIDVEQKTNDRRIYFANNVGGEIDVIALLIGMIFHRMRLGVGGCGLVACPEKFARGGSTPFRPAVGGGSHLSLQHFQIFLGGTERW